MSKSHGSRVSVSYLMTAFVSVQHYPLKQENCVRKECLQSVFLHSFFGNRNSASLSICTWRVESDCDLLDACHVGLMVGKTFLFFL